MAMPAAFAVSRDVILLHAGKLPAAPQVLGGLCALLKDVNTELEQIAERVRMDPALSARVIRMSNSVVFGGRGSVSSVDEAVSRVGFSEIVRLVGVATVAGLVDRSLTAYGLTADRLRESLLLHALAAEELAGETTVEPHTAYAGGLLRGIGMMVLDRVARGREAKAPNFDPAKFATYADWERQRFGVTACEVATLVLDDWRFPEELIHGIEFHLAPPEDEPAVFPAVLNLAGSIVAASGLGLAGEAQVWDVTPAKLAAAGITADQLEAVSHRARATFERHRHGLY